MTYEAIPQIGTPLDSAINEMDVIAETYPTDRDYLEIIKGSLVHIRERHNEGELTTEQASLKLFNLYFHHQSGAQDFGPLAHILRVVGDDFGVQQGADFDELWEIYQRSLEMHS